LTLLNEAFEGKRILEARARQKLLAAFEILHGSLVRLGGFSCPERAQIPPPAGFRILLPRVKPVFARLELPDH